MPLDALQKALLFSQFTGFVTQAAGQFIEGEQQAEAASFNAAVQRQQSRLIAQGRALERVRERREKEAFLSRQRAGFAKAGVRGVGSPLEVIADTATDFELDIVTRDFNSQIDRFRSESQAREDDRRSSQIRSSSRTNAGLTLLEGFSDITRTAIGLRGQ